MERGTGTRRLSWAEVRQLDLRGLWAAIRDWLWPPTLARGVVLAIVLLALILGGYVVPWTGFGEVGSGEDLQRAKSLWDWMELAIVPLLLAVGAYLLNQEAARRAGMLDAANTRNARTEEVNNARETAVREYLSQMGRLMIEHSVRSNPANVNEDAKRYMEALTLSILQSFSTDRNAQNLPSSVLQVEDGTPGSVKRADRKDVGKFPQPVRDYPENFLDLRKEILQFLHRAGLIEAANPAVSLEGADLAKADLSFVDLEYAGLAGVNLRGATLINAKLAGADLRNSILAEALLAGADLTGANLTGAVLDGAAGLP